MDFYKFNLDTQGTVKFGLTGLSANANILLVDSNGTGLAVSGKSGTSDEYRVVPNLAAGDY
ncbi:MAG: PPC domain-containing protein [Pleurocapsa sp.]